MAGQGVTELVVASHSFKGHLAPRLRLYELCRVQYIILVSCHV
jgi:hypothetical protein